ncbi:uncharacterized protein [Nicotiana sylvestris]|uniref:uncharacterized protein n=1 Tax=Nicotiana sylvestris TaxID=4096 RepID=UPI00388C3A95
MAANDVNITHNVEAQENLPQHEDSISDTRDEEDIAAPALLEKESLSLGKSVQQGIEKLLSVSVNGMPWFADVANFFVTGVVPRELSSNQRKKLKRDSLDFYWDESYLFKICTDGVIRRCVPEEEQLSILEACHSSPYGCHHGGVRIALKVLSCGFYWPTLYKDASEPVKRCNECQRAGGISKKDEMHLNTILEVDIFDVWVH